MDRSWILNRDDAPDWDDWESFIQKYKPLHDLPTYTGKARIIEAIKAYDSKAQ